MKRSRHTPEQAVRNLREGERMLNEATLLFQSVVAYLGIGVQWTITTFARSALRAVAEALGDGLPGLMIDRKEFVGGNDL